MFRRKSKLLIIAYKIWLPPTIDLISYHPPSYKYPAAHGQPNWLPSGSSITPRSAIIKASLLAYCFPLPKHSSPDPATPFRFLHKISPPLPPSPHLTEPFQTSLSKRGPSSPSPFSFLHHLLLSEMILPIELFHS